METSHGRGDDAIAAIHHLVCVYTFSFEQYMTHPAAETLSEVTPLQAVTPLTLIRFLMGKRSAILDVAASPYALVLGGVLVLSAGFAREYDGEDLLQEPATVGDCFCLASCIDGSSHRCGLRGWTIVASHRNGAVVWRCGNADGHPICAGASPASDGRRPHDGKRATGAGDDFTAADRRFSCDVHPADHNSGSHSDTVGADHIFTARPSAYNNLADGCDRDPDLAVHPACDSTGAATASHGRRDDYGSRFFGRVQIYVAA